MIFIMQVNSVKSVNYLFKWRNPGPAPAMAVGARIFFVKFVIQVRGCVNPNVV
jgi:hypothetical protein